MTRSSPYEVTFRSKELGLGLTSGRDKWNEPCIKVVSVVGAAATAGVQPGDFVASINGVKIRQRSLDEVLKMLHRTTSRPLRLGFVTERSDYPGATTALPPRRPPTAPPVLPDAKSGVSLVEIRCRVSSESPAPSSPTQDAILAVTVGVETGSVRIRGALTTGRRRSVVAVRSVSGCVERHGVKPGDTLVAVDSTLVVPPPEARGIKYLVGTKMLSQNGSEVTLLFARGDANDDVLYTLALPAEGEQRVNSISASWGVGSLPKCATEKWGLELEQRRNLLVVSRVTERSTAARPKDVVAVLGTHRVARSNLLAFGVAADAAVAAASTKRRNNSVPLTLALPSLVQARPDLFLEHDAEVLSRMSAPPPTGAVAGDEKLPDYDELERGGARQESVALDEMRPSDRRMLAQLDRLLRQGTGAKMHAIKGGRPATKAVVLRDVGDFSGFQVVPVYGNPIVVYFDGLVSVDSPMSSRYDVSSETLAASFTVKYRDDEKEKRLDLSMEECPALSYSIAEGLLLARQQIAETRTALDRRVSDVVEAENQNRMRGSSLAIVRPVSTSRQRSARQQGSAIQTAPSRVSARRIGSALMLADDTKKQWWRTLSKGVVVEVMYARDTYTVRTPLGDVNLETAATTVVTKRSKQTNARLGNGASSPSHLGRAVVEEKTAVFADGQYCRAVVRRVVRTRNASGVATRYVLAYLDGPYDADVGVFNKTVQVFPKGTLFINVPRAVIVVKYDNQQQYFPFAMILLSGLQIAAFLFYANRKPGGYGSVSAGSPVVGPSWLHYELISDFPQCEDRRDQSWRLFTYQFAHIGYTHLASNIFVQLVFGVPVELVHGHLIVFMVYQLGVALGALTCAFSDIHKSVVGASGGVYTLIGLHTADVLVNWRAMAQDFRIVIRGALCLVVPTVDIVVYALIYRDSTVSYAAHIGGYIGGFLLGASFLRPIDETLFHRYFTRPLAVLLLIAFVAFSIAWFCLTYPPKYFLNGPFWRLGSYSVEDQTGSCCTMLIDCEDVPKEDYHLLSCDEGTTLFPGRFNLDTGLHRLTNCTQILNYLASPLAAEDRASSLE